VNGQTRRQISTAGGYAATWGRDGKTLYYRRIASVNGVSDIISVDLSAFPAVGKETLFASALAAVRGGQHHTGYDVAGDGRLLIVEPSGDELAPLHFEVVLNWFQELKQRVPVAK
jgi:hypothetical protein